jgi:hypothetical protein
MSLNPFKLEFFSVSLENIFKRYCVEKVEKHSNASHINNENLFIDVK